MQQQITSYTKLNLTVFSINIDQKAHPSGKWKKNILFPNGWSNLTVGNTIINNTYNGIAMLTGKINNIIVIDIDNVAHWDTFLDIHKQTEPDTVKAISGSGGIHLYFTYEQDVSDLKSLDHCFGKDYDIDIKTNGGCVIVPPSKYFNKNLKKNVAYRWEKSIFETDPKPMPMWMKKILLDRRLPNKIDKQLAIKVNHIPSSTIIKSEKKLNIKKKKNTTSKMAVDDIIDNTDIILNIDNTDNINDIDSNIDFSEDDIEILLDMLNISRCDNYNDWINVGMCLHNINSNYFDLWKRWSQNSEKYEDKVCQRKWDSFKKGHGSLKIGSLLL